MKHTHKVQGFRSEPFATDLAGGSGLVRQMLAGHDILSTTMDLLRQCAADHDKPVPLLSQDAATFLITRRWAADELAQRVARAVAANEGSLITAADLS